MLHNIFMTAGAWLVAHQAEQKRHFQAQLSTQGKTYAQIKEERRQKEKAEALEKALRLQRQGQENGTLPPPTSSAAIEGSVTEGVLDGYFLVNRTTIDYHLK